MNKSTLTWEDAVKNTTVEARTFADAVKNTTVEARTWNGMKAQESSLSEAVDLFYKIGASRGRDVTGSFEGAFQDNSDVALRIALWARDVRGGAGERQIFRDILKHLEVHHRDVLLGTSLLSKVPELGRWDDLLVFSDPDVRNLAFQLISYALSRNDGLCAKWMPRKGPVAVELRKYLGLSPKAYRKLLVSRTDVVESKMCAKEFESINFSHVPSLAMSRYMKAFGRNAPETFGIYMSSLERGDPSVKVNAGAVYPYNVVQSVRRGSAVAVSNAQWDALPNYMGESKVLPLVDVSGSMCCLAGGPNSKSEITCLDVAVSLGLYCADKNTGPFKDLFLTFSDKSSFVHLMGSLSQKVVQMEDSTWEMSTNLHSAFDEILRVATNNSVAPDQMPDTLLILSDMQFNQCVRNDDSAIQMIERKYERAGYKVPNVVFWNLNAADNVPCSFDKSGVALVSGFSPGIMKAVLAMDLESLTPETLMLKAVMDDRYNYL